MSESVDLYNALGKLRRYAAARDRNVDRELREVTLTDDEALAVLEALDDHRSLGR